MRDTVAASHPTDAEGVPTDADLVGAASVMCLVLALSHLYVGRYPIALAELAGFALGAVAFFWSYGPYLAVLESRAPVEPDTKPVIEPDAVNLARIYYPNRTLD